MAIYEIDLVTRKITKDGNQVINIPSTMEEGDECYEILHLDDVQLAAVEAKPESIEPSHLKRARFRVNPDDKFALIQRQVQAMGAHLAKYQREHYSQPVNDEDLPK